MVFNLPFELMDGNGSKQSPQVPRALQYEITLLGSSEKTPVGGLDDVLGVEARGQFLRQTLTSQRNQSFDVTLVYRSGCTGFPGGELFEQVSRFVGHWHNPKDEFHLPNIKPPCASAALRAHYLNAGEPVCRAKTGRR
jgi:hypothetical protein